MQGGINLKEFILGVKRELVEASDEGRKDPRFELSEMELEAEFSLEASAEAEGGFKFLVKVAGEAKGAQTHKVRLLFRPLAAAASETEAHVPGLDFSTPVLGEKFVVEGVNPRQTGLPRGNKTDPRWALFKIVGADELLQISQGITPPADPGENSGGN